MADAVSPTTIELLNRPGVHLSVHSSRATSLRRGRLTGVGLCLLVLVVASCGPSSGTVTAPGETAGGTLAEVQARGSLRCGVSTSRIGFAEPQADGSFAGFDADFCRALAAVVLGDAEAVEFVGLTAAERFNALAAGEVDVLFRSTTWTQSRDTEA